MSEFLILDPFLFLLPETPYAGSSNILSFFRCLNRWAKELTENPVRFGTSTECIHLLKGDRRSVFNRTTIKDVTYKLKAYDESLVHIVLQLTSLLEETEQLAQVLGRINNDVLVYEIKDVTYSPKEFGSRLCSESLENAFREMLGNITFARAQRVFPISEFDRICIATTYSELDKYWILDEKLYVHVHCDFCLDEQFPLSEGIPLTPHKDEYALITNPKSISETQPSQKVAPIPIKEAVERLAELSGKRLVLSEECKDDLQLQHYSPFHDKIVKIIDHLDKVWLREFESNIKRHVSPQLATQNAIIKLREVIPHQTHGEGEQVKQNPKWSSQFDVHVGDKIVSAKIHVKIGNQYSIYFCHICHEGSYAVVLGRMLSKHPSTAKFKS